MFYNIIAIMHDFTALYIDLSYVCAMTHSYCLPSRFMLSDPDVPIKEKAASDQDRIVTFLGLIPGKLYNITMWTVSGGVTSRPIERQWRLHPEPVSNINAFDISDRSISLTWAEPRGHLDSFEVSYQDAPDHVERLEAVTNSISIGNLRPYSNYTFTIVTKVEK